MAYLSVSSHGHHLRVSRIGARFIIETRNMNSGIGLSVTEAYQLIADLRAVLPAVDEASDIPDHLPADIAAPLSPEQMAEGDLTEARR